MTNIENFNKGAQEYGLSKEFTFQSGDLWEVRKGPFLNVLNGVHSLGFVVSISSLQPYVTIYSKDAIIHWRHHHVIFVLCFAGKDVVSHV